METQGFDVIFCSQMVTHQVNWKYPRLKRCLCEIVIEFMYTDSYYKKCNCFVILIFFVFTGVADLYVCCDLTIVFHFDKHCVFTVVFKLWEKLKKKFVIDILIIRDQWNISSVRVVNISKHDWRLKRNWQFWRFMIAFESSRVETVDNYLSTLYI